MSGRERSSTEMGTFGTAASVAASGSAPSPGSSRPCSASSRRLAGDGSSGRAAASASCR